ncbi:MAG: hypothetical protein MJZ66_02535 [Bacteroidales bacterium]|nr:hypothetical protein [Bacteroidales bacterium]
MRTTIYCLMLAVLLMAASCAPAPKNAVQKDSLPGMFPDYAGVTIPADIAPLNFEVSDAECVYVEARGGRQGSLTAASGKTYADFDIEGWHQLTRQNCGDSIYLSVCALRDGQWTQYRTFGIFVSPDPLPEYGVTYRKIEPGYETFSQIGIFQRCIHTFDEYAIVAHTALQGQCMNCHVANRCDASQFQLHIRGQHPATLVQVDGQRTLLNTSTDSTIANCMYPYWHPSGRYIAYSLNLINQCFFEDTTKTIEVFDLASDALVLDLQTNELILSDLLMTKDFESYPAFSADGNTIYFCTSRPWMDEGLFDSIRYDLCSIAFDAKNGKLGNHVDTIIAASKQGYSITHPRPSYDGKFLLYSTSSCSVFPIHHPESDLWLLDLATMESHPLTEANSNGPESFHNWSTNSRWIVFASKRHNGLNNLLYFSHVDSLGHASKAFLLPQQNPRQYYDNLMHSYNVPDFTMQKVDLDVRAFAGEVFGDERIQVGVRR